MNHALQRMTALLLAGVLAGSGMTAAALATPEQAATPEAAAPVLPPEVPAATPEQTEPAAAVPDAAAAPRAAGQVVEGTVSPHRHDDQLIRLLDHHPGRPGQHQPPRPEPGHQRRQGADFYGQSRAGRQHQQLHRQRQSPHRHGAAHPAGGLSPADRQRAVTELPVQPRPAQRWQGLLPQRAGSFADRRGRLLLLQLHPGFRPVRRGFQHLYPLHPAGCAHRRRHPAAGTVLSLQQLRAGQGRQRPQPLPSTTISA